MGDMPPSRNGLNLPADSANGQGPESCVAHGGIAVLKFGGSVLRGPEALPVAVHEIYRELRLGRRVVAVVSAFYGETDRLVAQAKSLSDEPVSVAMLCATGEAASVAMLGLALDRAGIPALTLPPSLVGIRTTGDLCDADPVDLSVDRTLAELEEFPVVVVPGFVGLSEDGHISLLGRGGSDLTALFFAERLGADVCRLVKDVDGVYTADPRNADGPIERYDHIHLQDACDMGDVVIQPKAREFAMKTGRAFELGRPAEPIWTRVDHAGATRTAPKPDVTALRVGLLGHGTVGGALADLLAAHPDRFELTGIGVRNLERTCRPEHKPLLTADLQRVADGCDLLIEVMGGIEPAGPLIRSVLERGGHAITANKNLIALQGDRLRDAARDAGGSLRYSAAVGGGMPAIELVDRVRSSGDRVTEVRGILNGTCNYILGKLFEGVAYEDAVRLAQDAGFAEADPTMDLDGTDVACKLAILIKHACGVSVPIESIEREALDTLGEGDVAAARAEGSVLRLVGAARIDHAEASGTGNTAGGSASALPSISATVALVRVPVGSDMAVTEGPWNLVQIETESGRALTVRGRGAGSWPTAEAVLADALDVYRASHPSVAHAAGSQAVPVLVK